MAASLSKMFFENLKTALLIQAKSEAKTSNIKNLEDFAHTSGSLG
jgi:hypothetical protein